MCVKKDDGNNGACFSGRGNTVAIQSDSRCARVVWVTVRSMPALYAGVEKKLRHGSSSSVTGTVHPVQHSAEEAYYPNHTRFQGDPR
jgi:hypothetical protein